MEIILCSDYEEVSKVGAKRLYEVIQTKKKINLGLATGATPLGLYKEFIRLCQQVPLNFSQVITFNLDEYVGLLPQSTNSYRYYMNKHLFLPLGVPLEQTHIPQGDVVDLEQECQRYEQLIAASGGIDIQLLGVGRNGHIGFNEPSTSFTKGTHVTTLSSSTREANAKYFNSLAEVPKQAITMGISTIMKAKKIILLASGQEKAEPIYHLLEGREVSHSWPVTVLKNHADVTVILDKQAASLTSKGETID